MTYPLLEQVRLAFEKYAAAGVVVAVSGGPDSVAMLSVLHALGTRALFVGHVNHHLRGAESDADAQFVERLAKQLDLPVQIESANVLLAAGGKNTEAVARHMRYEALLRIADQFGADTIATAHTLDDQAETVLLRLLRGTGLAGLAGIAPVRRHGSVRIIRPLLHVCRAEVISYLKSTGTEYRIDASNSDIRFTRNRLRLQLLPAIASVAHPGWKERLGRLADEARRYARRQRRVAGIALQQTELSRAGVCCVFDAQKLAHLSQQHICVAMRLLWHRERWPTLAMTRRHWGRLADLCRGGSTALDLPGGIRARRLARVVRIGPGA